MLRRPLHRLLLVLYRWLPKRLQEVAAWLLSPRMAVGVSVAALDDDGRVLLFQHRYEPPSSPRLPGGFLRRGEQPHRALMRELAEEGGAEVELRGVAHLEVSERWPAQMTIYYAGTLLGPPERTTAEVAGWEMASPDALPPSVGADQRAAIRAARRGRGRGYLPE